MLERLSLSAQGAMPQASYGKEAGSISWEAIQKMGSMAAIAVGTNTRGQCTTTRIWLSLGIHNDPWVKCIVDQVKTWLWLYACSLLPQDVLDPKLCRGAIVHRNWDIAKAKILGSLEPFKKVLGPMGAIIALLQTIGWTPVAPNKWVDIEGGQWKYVGGNYTPLLDKIREDMTVIIWILAEGHHNGKGLAGTP